MHHGDILIQYPMSSAIQEMVDWANAHTNPEDLVGMLCATEHSPQRVKDPSDEKFYYDEFDI
tara:strand:- start:216 stop:401 length:186 start_codon:yes stop_codon:yes gene_type:complete